MAEPTIRVVLVDDHDLVRAGFATILSTTGDIEVVGECGDGASAVAAVARLAPDVVCMDVQMPTLDGIEATERIVASGSKAAVLMLTTFAREDYLVAALRAGASGFLLKNARPEELISAIRSLANGDALLSPALTMALIERFVRRQDEGAGPLTARETDVLRLIAKGLANDEIAAELHLTRATVKTHVSAILAKLGVRDRVQAVVWAFEHHLV